jgi:outer membrane immunogenic protein
MNKFSIILKSFSLSITMIGIASAENTWTGFYAGVNAGNASNKIELQSQQFGFDNIEGTCNRKATYSTLYPGVQLGYMHQFSNNLVSGIETNFTLNQNQKKILSCKSEYNAGVYDRFTFRNQMQTSIKARVGSAINFNNNNYLPYLTAGAALATVGLTYRNEGGDYYSTATTKTNWLIGAGIEWAFMQHWSLRAEYNYVNYKNTINLKIPSVYDLLDPDGGSRVHINSSNVFVAISYWI